MTDNFLATPVNNGRVGHNAAHGLPENSAPHDDRELARPQALDIQQGMHGRFVRMLDEMLRACHRSHVDVPRIAQQTQDLKI